MKCWVIEIVEPESSGFLAEMGGRWFWAGAANNTKMPKLYTTRKDAERVLGSTNSYLQYDKNKRIVEVVLTLPGS